MSNLVTINIDATSRAEQVDRLRDALIARNGPEPTYYVRTSDGRLARIDRSSGMPVITPVDQSALAEIAMRAYHWKRPKGDKTIHVDPPATVIRAVAAEPGPDLPRLQRIVSAPYMAATGRVVHRHGYDDECETFLDLDQQIDIPDDPDPEQLADAVKVIADDALAGFVFADKASRANAIAAAMTCDVQALYPDELTPIFAIDAPDNNYGKTTLAQAIVAPLVGESPAVTPMTMTDSTECRRTIYAILRDDPASIILDNVSTKLAGDAIASVKTAHRVRDRAIKTSTAPLVETRALWFGTGTLLTFSRELCIRSVLVQLVAKPTGTRAPITWATKNRLVIVRARLTVLRAWIARERPLADVRHPKYPRWAAIVGGILQVMGVEGMLANQHLLDDRDDESRAWVDLIERWAVAPGGPDRHRRVTEIIECAAIAGEPAWDLIEAGGDANSRAMILGHALRRRADGPAIAGWVIRTAVDTHVKVHNYWLEAAASVPGSAHAATDPEPERGACGGSGPSDNPPSRARARTRARS